MSLGSHLTFSLSMSLISFSKKSALTLLYLLPSYYLHSKAYIISLIPSLFSNLFNIYIDAHSACYLDLTFLSGSFFSSFILVFILTSISLWSEISYICFSHLISMSSYLMFFVSIISMFESCYIVVPFLVQSLLL